jgi:hypothetical protein
MLLAIILAWIVAGVIAAIAVSCLLTVGGDFEEDDPEKESFPK